MQLKTIVNRVTNYKSFVVGKVKWSENTDRLELEIEMRSRANGRAICSGCGKTWPGYDRAQQPRRFDFIPIWAIAVVFVYHMRRVDCPDCGVKVERVPWSDGKSPMTTEYHGSWRDGLDGCPGKRFPKPFTEVGTVFTQRWNRP